MCKQIKKHTFIIVIALYLFATPAIAGLKDTTYGDAIVSEVTSIYNGDTFRCNIVGYPDIIGKHITIIQSTILRKIFMLHSCHI